MDNYRIGFFSLLLSFSFLFEVNYAADFVLDTMKKDGYVGEAHNVTTEDGYILTLQRINGGSNSTPVLLVSGFLFSSASWVILGPKRSLPYLLADQGYDVWLGNNRGNNYGNSHVNISSDDDEFWDFSFHEMGMYDLPAMIDYISELRKQNIFYIGYSQGTQTAYIMASRRPEYAKKIRMMVALAPVAFIPHLKGLFRIIYHMAGEWMRYLPIKTLLYPTSVFRFLQRRFCTPFAFQSYVCKFILSTIVGFDFEQFDDSDWEKILQGTLAGSSLKNGIHYAQHMRSGRFDEYDYGERRNIQLYNQTMPPVYDLTKVNLSIIFFCSKADWLSNYSDAIVIYKLLPQTKGFYTLEYKKFTHCDYVWAKNAKEVVYDHLINRLNSYRDS